MRQAPSRLFVYWQWFGFPCRVRPRVQFAALGLKTGVLSVSWFGSQVSVFWGEAAQGYALTIDPLGPGRGRKR